ncbi:MAG: hypothetical protein MJZ37_04525 [Bacilli bacterium]|nr:hypothetical protein [Bacilli bacterium]
MENKSIRYEFDFIHYLNNKKVSELTEKWQKHLRHIFPGISDDTTVFCAKHENYFAKGDIDIRIKGSKKIVSLKNGKNPTMHREKFSRIYQFLKELGISRKTLNMITLYQFGDCYAYGHFDKPLNKEEIVEQYGDKILEANKELCDEKIIDAIIRRSIIKGAQDYRQEIDFLYYGNLEKGILISVDQIYQSIKSRKELPTNWIQFGQLVFQPGGRSRKNNDYCESTIHWPVLSLLFNIAEDQDDILKCKVEK